MSDKPKQKEHPLYSAFGHLLGGLLLVARKIACEMQSDTPPKVKRFLEIFDKKTA